MQLKKSYSTRRKLQPCCFAKRVVSGHAGVRSYLYTSLASFAESVKAHSCEVLLYFLSILAFLPKNSAQNRRFSVQKFVQADVPCHGAQDIPA